MVPTGTKRVGSVDKVDEKSGCTLMVGLDLNNSKLTKPVVIFKGEIGKTLDKRYSKYKSTGVYFTPSHWMTHITFVRWLRDLRVQYRHLRRLGVIVDVAPCHMKYEIDQYIASTLVDDESNGPQLFLDFVDPNLTSIYQVGDVYANKTLKQYIRSGYFILRELKLQQLLPGEKLQLNVYRGELVMLIEKAFNTFNEKQTDPSSSHFQGIKKAFSTCGLDPYNEDCEANLNSYLSELANNPILSSLLVNAPNFAVELDGNLEDDSHELIEDVDREDKFDQLFTTASASNNLDKFATSDLDNLINALTMISGD